MPSLEVQEARIWDRYYKRLSGELPSKKKETLESVHELIEWNRNYNTRFLPEFIKQCAHKERLNIINENIEIYKYLDK